MSSFRLKPWMLIVSALVVALLMAIFMFFANSFYWHPQDRPWIRKTAISLHLPVARVGSHAVSYEQYYVQQDATRTFLRSPAAQGENLPTDVDARSNQTLLTQLIRAAAVQELADEHKLTLTNQDVDKTYSEIINRAGTSTNLGEVAMYLKDTFGWTEDQFKQNVVRPATLETAVKQEAYNNDNALFQTALEEKIKQAKIYIKL